MTRILSFLVVFCALALPAAQAEAATTYPIVGHPDTIELLVAREWERRYNATGVQDHCTGYYARNKARCRWRFRHQRIGRHHGARNRGTRARRSSYHLISKRLNIKYGSTRQTNRGRR